MLREYYRLTKPGIIYGNALTTLAAFLYASRWHFSFALFIATMLGIALVIASACVFNNYLDREIDAKMTRTKERALVKGKISNTSALVYATALGICGFVLLIFLVNLLTAQVALVGFVFYVFLYTFSKRSSALGTLVGSVSGATPIVVGYVAVTDRFDAAALVLFLILVAWQMPHFYAIALRRIDEYRAADIPVLPAVRGARITKMVIVLYIVAYLAAVSTLTLAGYAGYVYLGMVLVSGVVWLLVAIKGFRTSNDEQWAKKTFLLSLIVLLIFCSALSIALVLP